MTPATIPDAFAASLERQPAATAMQLVAASGDETRLSRLDLYRGVCRMAQAMHDLGMRRAAPLVLALPTSRELLELYLACLWNGVIPLLAPPPRSGLAGAPALARLAELADAAGAERVVLPGAGLEAELRPLIRRAIGVQALADLPQREAQHLRPVAAPGDVAHLQATSGSTGRAKLVVIRHSNLAANVRAIGRASGQRQGDTVVSWLPLYHDMGLIGVCCCLDWECPLIATDPANFVRNPINFWLRLIGRFGGTISPAPASAYEVCARLARRRPCTGLDLTSWRVAYCGAEPIRASTLRDFHAVFGPHGLPPTTLLPVYGLAEATLAVSIPPLGRAPRVDTIDAGRLYGEGLASPVPPDVAGAPGTLQVVAVGPPLPGHAVRIAGPGGQRCGERQVGEVQCSGPSVADELWQDPQGSAALRTVDGYLPTGDLGYLAGGELHLTGRLKEILIIRGRNFMPEQIEAVVEPLLDSTGTHGVAAVGVSDETTGSEALHLLIETRQAPAADLLPLEERIRQALDDALGVAGAFVHWVERGEIPKTTSGKIRRHLCRELAAARLAGAAAVRAG